MQGDVTVTDISRALRIPQSSTSLLLGTLVDIGYLSYDVVKRTYRPTVRVALLGTWVHAPFFREGRLHRLMNALKELTGEKIILAIQTGTLIRSIHSVQGDRFTGRRFRIGAPRPLARSGFGPLFLSRYAERDIRRIVTRVNAERQIGQDLLDPKAILDQVDKVRRDGYCFSAGILTPGIHILSQMLPREENEPPLAIGIGSMSPAMESCRDRYLDHIRSGIEKYLS